RPLDSPQAARGLRGRPVAPSTDLRHVRFPVVSGLGRTLREFPPYSIIAFSSATLSIADNVGNRTSSTPPEPSDTGNAPVRARSPRPPPADRSGAMKQTTARRERPAMVLMALAAAAASAYGPGGQSLRILASSSRRTGSLSVCVAAKPPIVASSHAITMCAGG